MRRLVAATATAAAVALSAHLGLPATAQAADPADPAEPRAATVRLLTNGFGHGRGLSQYGAQARAKLGHTRQEILRFYYPGLATGTSTGSMKVLITADTSSDVVIVDRAGLSVRSLGTGKAYRLDSPVAAKRWKIVAASGGRSTVAWRAATGSWRTWRTLAGQAEFSAGGLPITLVTPTGTKAYRGALRSALPSSSATTRDTVNVVPLESYLRGVVPREVFASWRPAALQAQAVAARTYAAFERNDRSTRYFHVDDTTSSQVYGGYADEVDTTDAAIKATAGQVLTSGGRPAFTQFSASNGGWTAGGSQTYQVARQDNADKVFRGVEDSIAPAELERALPAIGTFVRLDTIRRDGHGEWGGRVTSIRVVGSKATSTLTGDQFRSFFGLNSTWFVVRA
ncbi:SpoIID/LytB domain-containing protein [Nocardioides plantarum]|uniref:SpoIID/LytB domain-containing protein n=1 Tax=Nocardioides plantarum TaxID=29299 RepID=A0ABV5K744_9ACTN|nr:SpoIID/LytB domain-containing protein [Nocardioides plantarum]